MRGRKLVTMLVALLGAILLWLYVVTSVAPEATTRVSPIPINIDGTIVLEERGLIITGRSAETLTLELSTSRVNLSKLNADSIRVNADASKIREPGEYTLNCSVTFPDTVRSSEVDIQRKTPNTVTITVSRLDRRTFSIQPSWTGAVQEGYLFEAESALIEPSEVVLEGPDYEVEQIERAVVSYDVSAMKQTEIVSVPIVFLNKDGEAVEFSELTAASVTDVNVTLPVFRTREITLDVQLNAGGGVKEENARVSIEPGTIRVKGAAELVEAMSDPFIIGEEIDLAAISDHEERTFNLALPTGVTNISGETEAHVRIDLTGVSSSNVSVSDIRLIHIPEGYEAEASTRTVKVRIRGSTDVIRAIQQAKNNGFYIEVDLSEAGQTGAFTASGHVIHENYPSVSVADPVEISVVITQTPED